MNTPARFRPVLFLALATLGCLLATPAQADTAHQTLTRNATLPNGGSVVVENLVGQMTVTQGSGPQVEITATVVAGGEDQAEADALAKLIRLSVDQSGKQLKVHVDYPVDQYDRYAYNPPRKAGDDVEHCLFGFLCGVGNSSLDYQGERVRVYQGGHQGVPLYVDVDVKVPAGINADVTNHIGFIKLKGTHSDVTLHADSGDVQINDTSGTLDVDTGSGDVGVADQSGALSIGTGSGDVKVMRVKGNLNLHTGSGDIFGGKLSGDTLKARTGSGDVTLDTVTGALDMRAGSGDLYLRNITSQGPATLHTGSGDITLSGNLSGMNGFDLHAGSGDITLITDQPPAVHLDIGTGSGDISVHWPGVNNATSSDDSFTGDIGAARATGRIHTGSGDVTLKH
ncbi:MAG TPA: DUF4097 family beta strand repeat-containing protein [Gammaproteobacteria bacterium]|nr:DUF4097 family beta strand repeat-containing protein [Gammaproteobacteria bacterium]